MKRICYCVAASLDGYISGPNGEADWIIGDPEIDFGAIFARYDTVLMGRKTYEFASQMGQGEMPGIKSYVVSTTLKPDDHKGLTIISGDINKKVAELRQGMGKDIWLFGGGALFRSLLDAKLVDTIEVAIIPVVLGAGIPFLPPPGNRASLKLVHHKVYNKTGIVVLTYEVN
jgi:dihydrofolate reductase